MDQSDQEHIDSAQRRWERGERASRHWSLVLRILPWAIVGLFLAVAFRVFG